MGTLQCITTEQRTMQYVDGWAVTFGTARIEGPSGLRPRPVPSSVH